MIISTPLVVWVDYRKWSGKVQFPVLVKYIVTFTVLIVVIITTLQPPSPPFLLQFPWSPSSPASWPSLLSLEPLAFLCPQLSFLHLLSIFSLFFSSKGTLGFSFLTPFSNSLFLFDFPSLEPLSSSNLMLPENLFPTFRWLDCSLVVAHLALAKKTKEEVQATPHCCGH